MARPLIIGIGGAGSGAGKTEAAVNLLKTLKGFGAIKCTKTALYSAMIDDPKVLRQKGKDSRRLLDAGAQEVLWVRSPAEGLEETLWVAFEKLSHLKGVIVEGNSAIEVLRPDIVIFISGSRRPKIGSERVLAGADAVIYGGTGFTGDLRHGAKVFGRDDIEGYTGYIREMVIKAEIKKKIEGLSSGGKIPCALARKIAEETGASYAEVGSMLNELKIKITDCGLGCF